MGYFIPVNDVEYTVHGIYTVDTVNLPRQSVDKGKLLQIWLITAINQQNPHHLHVE